MTEEISEAPVVEESNTENGETTTGRGRPRPQDTQERDEVVFNHLAKHAEIVAQNTTDGDEKISSGLSKAQLSQDLGMPLSKTYLSLYRLSRGNRIHKVGREWFVGSAPASADTDSVSDESDEATESVSAE